MGNGNAGHRSGRQDWRENMPWQQQRLPISAVTGVLHGAGMELGFSRICSYYYALTRTNKLLVGRDVVSAGERRHLDHQVNSGGPVWSAFIQQPHAGTFKHSVLYCMG